jgi:hypothetical protein
MRTRIRRLDVLAMAAVLSAGCTSPFQISRQARDPVPVVSEDGLYRVEASQVGAAYLRAGASFADYDAVVLDPCSLAYKSPPDEKTIFRRAIGNYLLNPDSSDRMKRLLRESFEREIDRSESFHVAAQAGPGALRISCQIVDLVWEVPDALGGETFWVKRTGVMTLLLNVSDSDSGTVLVRIADRRAIRPQGEALVGGYENRPVNNWAAVRQLSERWARMLREALDSLHLPPA